MDKLTDEENRALHGVNSFLLGLQVPIEQDARDAVEMIRAPLRAMLYPSNAAPVAAPVDPPAEDDDNDEDAPVSACDRLHLADELVTNCIVGTKDLEATFTKSGIQPPGSAEALKRLKDDLDDLRKVVREEP